MDIATIFIVSLAFPFFFWRIVAYYAPKWFVDPPERRATGLQIHHLHYGIVFILAANLIAITRGQSGLTVALEGLGLGQMLDLTIASVLMKGNRKQELKLYKETAGGTVWMIAIIALIFLITAILL